MLKRVDVISACTIVCPAPQKAPIWLGGIMWMICHGRNAKSPSAHFPVHSWWILLSVNPAQTNFQSEGNNIWAGDTHCTDAESYGVSLIIFLMLNYIWFILKPLSTILNNVYLSRSYLVSEILHRKSMGWYQCKSIPHHIQSNNINVAFQLVVEAFFSRRWNPRTSIKPHSEFTNFVLTSHLPLANPENGNNKCRLSVGDETRQWLEGKIILFDTPIDHESINDSDEMRYILMLRTWHPDLTREEQEALQLKYDCLEIPELLSSDPGTMLLAEQRAKSLREFPLRDRLVAAALDQNKRVKKQK